VSLEPLPDDWSKALCIAAHPDDLEYGVAIAVARWTGEGKEVAYVLATSGEAGIDGLHPDEAGPRREQEERAGAAEVGVSTVEFLGLQDGVLEAGLELRKTLARAIRRHRPELVVTLTDRMTFGGYSFNMADHRIVGLAVLDACRDAGNRWIFTELLDEGFEPWDGVQACALAGSPEATHGTEVQPEHLEAGIRSLEAHQRYLEGIGGMDVRGFLTGSAQRGGQDFGTDLAVTYEGYLLSS
jgi:LmbE family N-acetylglucosaminyl deacetylase